jgi:hypothetical protein
MLQKTARMIATEFRTPKNLIHGRRLRRIEYLPPQVHFGTARSPSDVWIAQQWRNATPFEEGPRFLIRDNDDKFGAAFSLVTGNVDVLKTPVRAESECPCED